VRILCERIDQRLAGSAVLVVAHRLAGTGVIFFPFSGSKGSFYGDFHMHGTDGADFYTKKKVVVSGWA